MPSVAVDNSLPADVVDAMRMKRTKSSHENQADKHHRSTVCETGRQ